MKRKITDDELWPIVHQLAAQQPDRTDRIDDLVLEQAGASRRTRRAYSRQLEQYVIGTGAVPPSLSGIFRILHLHRRLSKRASSLLAFLAGLSTAGCRWEDIATRGFVEFELVMTVAPDRLRTAEADVRRGKPGG